jgi:phage terminase large subunit-like protein
MALKAGPKGRASGLDLTDMPASLPEARIWALKRFCGVDVYAWQADEMARVGDEARPRVHYTQVPRKNGKTMNAGGALALTEMILRERRHIYAVSDSERNLNSALIREVRDLVFRSPELDAAVHVTKHGLECPSTGSFIETRPNTYRAMQSINPHLVVFDEVHLQRSDETWNGAQMAGAARDDFMLYGITTPGYDVTSLAHGLYEAVKAGTLSGTIYEPHDPSCALDDRDAWRQANPAFDEIPGFADAMAYDFLHLPEHDFRRFRLGQWTTAASAWLPYGAWAACKDATRLVGDRSEVVLGFDGSFSGDSTALVGCTLDGHLFVVGAWENPGRKGWRVPRDDVLRVVDEAFGRYEVLELCADPPYWQRELEEWAQRYGSLRVVEFPTNRRERMAPASTAFYSAVMERALTHDGDARLARHVANCVVRTTPQGDVVTKLDKDSPAKIDLAVAAILAHSRARWHANRRGGVNIF